MPSVFYLSYFNIDGSEKTSIKENVEIFIKHLIAAGFPPDHLKYHKDGVLITTKGTVLSSYLHALCYGNLELVTVRRKSEIYASYTYYDLYLENLKSLPENQLLTAKDLAEEAEIVDLSVLHFLAERSKDPAKASEDFLAEIIKHNLTTKGYTGEHLNSKLLRITPEAIYRIAEETSRDEEITKFDELLNGLYDKVGQIHQHNTSASTLVSQLQRARLIYGQSIRAGTSPERASDLLLRQCQIAINNAIPGLEKDLGWGDYLLNLLKSLANAIVYGVTFGNTHNYFKKVIPPSSSLVAEFNGNLQINAEM